MHFFAYSSGSALPEENVGSDKEDGASEESILDNLSPVAGDVSPMGSQEYDKWCAEMDAAIAANAQEMILRSVNFEEETRSAPPKQVMATVANLEEGGSSSDETPTDAGIPAPAEPPVPVEQHAPPREIRPVEQLVVRNLDFGGSKETQAEAILRVAGEEGEKIVYGEILMEPITPAVDPIALEAKRVELYEQAQEIAKLNSMVVLMRRSRRIPEKQRPQEKNWRRNSSRSRMKERS